MWTLHGLPFHSEVPCSSSLGCPHAPYKLEPACKEGGTAWSSVTAQPGHTQGLRDAEVREFLISDTDSPGTILF